LTTGVIGWIITAMNWQVAAWMVAVVGGLIAAGLAIYEAFENRKLRERELRWKQAESGKRIIDEIFHEPGSNAATLMLDSWHRSYDIDGKETKIAWQDVISALNVESFQHEDKRAIFVRDCFDLLFYYLDGFEHFIQAGLTTFEDVRFPTEYYIDMMAEDEKEKAIIIAYIRECKYRQIWQFLDRFPSWTGRSAKKP
jgi:hypothetical protein